MSIPNNFDDFLNGPAIILGLSNHKYRYEYTLLKLKAAGFNNISFFEGTNGRTDDIETISKSLNLGFLESIKMDKPSVGFTISCVRIWNKIVDENLPYLIIFEDDALPEPDFKNIAKEWYDKTPKEFDFLYLGSQLYLGDNPQFTKKNHGKHVIKEQCYCTHAYVVTQNGAIRALELVKESSNKNALNKGDCQILEWMRSNKIVWYNWNNIGIINKSFPIGINNIRNHDSIYRYRDDGLIYQNYKFNSIIDSVM